MGGPPPARCRPSPDERHRPTWRDVKPASGGNLVIEVPPLTLWGWAVGFQKLVADRRPLPRVGLHYGLTLYRDGDYYGREVNIAARVAARAAGGEVLVTSPVVELAGAHLEFERIGEVRLKGFREATELFVAREIDDDG